MLYVFKLALTEDELHFRKDSDHNLDTKSHKCLISPNLLLFFMVVLPDYEG